MIEYVILGAVGTTLSLACGIQLKNFLRTERQADVKSSLYLAMKCDHVEGVLRVMRDHSEDITNELRAEVEQWFYHRRNVKYE